MLVHYRRLPHFEAVGQPVFVTFRLYGSLPPNRVFPRERLSSGRAFAAMDRLMDQARAGPLFLKEPEIARVVVRALLDGQERFGRYQLHAYVVMPNHVHLLATPRVVAARWLGPLKGYTARKANATLGREGPFWQDESYDHLIRNRDEFQRVLRYIDNNPVRAGLARSPEEFRWSSAGAEAPGAG